MAGRVYSGDAAGRNAPAAPDSDVEAMRLRLHTTAHEIRTPLSGAAAIADILATSGALEGQMQDYVMLLRDALNHSLAITNDILDMSKLEANLGLGPRQSFSPATSIQSIAALARPRAQARGLWIRTTTETVHGLVVSYPVLLRRIVENLVDNALKHTRAGGISITLRPVRHGVLGIDVADTGSGIAESDLPLLFKPYTQLENGARAGGTGLGLALVKSALDSVGGSVVVNSCSGIGTTFRVRLPVEAVAATGARREATRAPRVLLVDANPMSRVVTGALITGNGNDHSFAADVDAAIEAIRAGDVRIVLLDADMRPDDAALTALRLVCSAHSVRLFGLGAIDGEAETFDGRLAKPLQPEALRAALADATFD